MQKNVKSPRFEVQKKSAFSQKNHDALDFAKKVCYTERKIDGGVPMRSNESAEMYLESILLLQQKQGHVRAIDIARHTGYTKPSISRAVGLLRTHEYITVDPSGFIELTESGKTLAEKIFERHRILTAFLEHVGVSAETADDDACKIEHVISDETVEKIKAFLSKK